MCQNMEEGKVSYTHVTKTEHSQICVSRQAGNESMERKFLKASLIGWREEVADIRKFSAFSHVLALLYEHLSKWTLSFSRLAGLVKSAVWMKVELLDALQTYGTAGGPKRPVIVEKQLYFLSLIHI